MKFLERCVAPLMPHLVLCTSEKEYLSLIKKLKIKDHSGWIPSRADACVYFFEGANNAAISCVCIAYNPDHTPIDIACLIVHEAVHIWQEYCDHIGEDTPGKEQEAYGIQFISQTLMEEYARRIK